MLVSVGVRIPVHQFTATLEHPRINGDGSAPLTPSSGPDDNWVKQGGTARSLSSL
jgi:hypothetical protein